MNCYWGFLTPFEIKLFIRRLFINLKLENHPELGYVFEIFNSVKNRCYWKKCLCGKH